MDASTIERFVRDAFSEPTGELALYVLTPDGSRMPCDRWAIGADVDDAWRETYEAIEERALRQVNTLGGVHSFVLELVRSPGEGQPPRVLRHDVFRVSAEAAPGRGYMMTEPPNEGGLIAQTMRHQEQTHRALLTGNDRALHYMTKILDRVSERADKMESKYLESMSLFMEARWASGEQEIELVKAQGAADAKRALASRVATILPALTGRAMEHFGRNGMPARLRGFVQSLEQAELAKIAMVLPPEKQAALFEILRPVLQELEQEQAEADAAAGKDGVH